MRMCTDTVRGEPDECWRVGEGEGEGEGEQPLINYMQHLIGISVSGC